MYSLILLCSLHQVQNFYQDSLLKFSIVDPLYNVMLSTWVQICYVITNSRRLIPHVYTITVIEDLRFEMLNLRKIRKLFLCLIKDDCILLMFFKELLLTCEFNH